MADLYELLEEGAAKPKPTRRVFKIILAVLITIILVGIMSFFVSVVYTAYYKDKVYPGVYVGNTSMGGLTKPEVKQFIENFNNRISKEGIALDFITTDGAHHGEKLSTITSGENAVELLRLDSDTVAADAFAMGRVNNWKKYVYPLLMRAGNVSRLTAPAIINPAPLNDILTAVAAPYEDSPHNAGFSFPDKSDLSNFLVVSEKSGQAINKDALVQNIKQQLGALSFDPIIIKTQVFEPTITAADVTAAAGNLDKLFAAGDIELNYVNPTTKERVNWSIAPAKFADWLEIKRGLDGNLVIGLAADKVNDYLDRSVRPVVDIPPENAKFIMENNKVKEFEGSHNGLGVDAEKTFADINSAFEERAYNGSDHTKTVSVSLQVTAPDIKTADVNSLGITDVIGVGQSTFYGSHANRIKNIAVAVKRLNGTIIKPGEEFSANKYAGPYTAESGFLPEMVIKGNRILPEIGGGMCQIGTTLFRMAMNSGMDITERRNHSLVVSYYSDPVNHNPGTDATLYDPSPDFKFVNDTGNYLLLQTAVDYKKQLITFTLWGKPDGRSGSYSHPIVSKWIPAPTETQYLTDTQGKIKPGEEECQASFNGAFASFTYTRTTPQGQTINRVFDSYYRPLPKICLVPPGSASSTPANVTGNLGEPLE